jgi:hypothetical protein
MFATWKVLELLDQQLCSIRASLEPESALRQQRREPPDAQRLVAFRVG